MDESLFYAFNLLLRKSSEMSRNQSVIRLPRMKSPKEKFGNIYRDSTTVYKVFFFYYVFNSRQDNERLMPAGNAQAAGSVGAVAYSAKVLNFHSALL